MNVCMVGWHHTRFGKLSADVEELIVEAAQGALEDAALAAQDIDAVFVGHFNAGFTRQGFTSALAAHADPAFRFKPITRVENACASGSAALYQGIAAIKSGHARHALVIGVEKMTATAPQDIATILLKASYLNEERDTPHGFAGVFARIARAYFERYGDRSAALARIAAKNHRNGCANPYAQIRKDLGFEFCATPSDGNPILAAPLRRTDCSPVSDGAAAVVITTEAIASTMRRAVRFRGLAQTSDYLPLSRREQLTSFPGCERAWKLALERAGASLQDLDLVETHDCFTIAELIEYEAMGLTPAGEGARAIEEGWTDKDGWLPVNPSGGLKAKGHPIGATGISMHIMAAMQLVEEAGGMQISNARLAGVFNMGGVAVANYCSILDVP